MVSDKVIILRIIFYYFCAKTYPEAIPVNTNKISFHAKMTKIISLYLSLQKLSPFFMTYLTGSWLYSRREIKESAAEK